MLILNKITNLGLKIYNKIVLRDYNIIYKNN